MTLQIAVEGNIASGKSTLLSNLSQLESVEVRDANTFFVTCKYSLVPKLVLLAVWKKQRKSGYSGAPTSGGCGMCIWAGEPHFQTLLFAIWGWEKLAQWAIHWMWHMSLQSGTCRWASGLSSEFCTVQELLEHRKTCLHNGVRGVPNFDCAQACVKCLRDQTKCPQYLRWPFRGVHCTWIISQQKACFTVGANKKSMLVLVQTILFHFCGSIIPDLAIIGFCTQQVIFDTTYQRLEASYWHTIMPNI